jgi:histidyl-tRNA synthetase
VFDYYNSVSKITKREKCFNQTVIITLMQTDGRLIEHVEGSYEARTELRDVLENLKKAGIGNAEFDLSIARGFDYYTGVVFEVFDVSPQNNRALFGGGRYDDLVGIFGVEKVPGMGFGMGDVTIRDFLETHNLLPEYQ